MQGGIKVRLRFSKKSISIEEKLELPLIGKTTHIENLSYQNLPQAKIQMIIKSIVPVIKNDVFVALEFEVEQLQVLPKRAKKEKKTQNRDEYNIPNAERFSDVFI